MDPIATFQKNIERQTQRAAALARKHRQFSLLRLGLFLLATIFFFYFFSTKAIWPLTGLLLTFPLLFGLLIKKHNRLAYEKQHALFLKKINEEEIARAKGELKAFAGGEAFMDADHAYSADLDIFGKNSLYRLLNRATTHSGHQHLAAWLQGPAGESTIAQRRAAIEELSPKSEWRQNFQASGLHFEDPKSEISRFLNWVNTPEQLPKGRVLSAAAYALPCIALLLLVLHFAMGVSLYALLGVLPFNFWVLRQVYQQVQQTTEETETSIKVLKAYAALIGTIEESSFQSPYLTSLKAAFANEGYKASEAIGKLQAQLERLRSRVNLLFGTFNVILLLDVHYLGSAIAWKKTYRQKVVQWFDAIGQYEALCSLSAFHYANPNYAFPEIRKESHGGSTPYFSAEALGHPLIRTAERVSNDFIMEGQGTVIVVTGSNMSGKSTFLRTVGINTVLAMAGAPVCAKKLSLSVVQLFTGMRSQDDLEEHVSSFYAELKRIRQLLDDLEKTSQPILFMLDEVLKGTNSRDRHLGAKALIHQLSTKKAFGFVSTHDLELGEMAETLPYATNYSFNSQIDGDEIHFDYRLTPGICRSFNASKLMENMGIIVS